MEKKQRRLFERKVLIKLKDKFYHIIICPDILYGSEC